MEYTKEYREFIDDVFGKKAQFYYPKPYFLTKDNQAELEERYKLGKQEHEKWFLDEPSIHYWTDDKNRFMIKHQTFLNVDLIRLTSSFVLKSINKKVFDFESSRVEDTHKDITKYNSTSMIREVRKEARDQSKPFNWRSRYPNTPYLYEDVEPETEATEEVDESNLKELRLMQARTSTSEENIKYNKFESCKVFKNGGPLFLPNPFNSEAIGTANLWSYIIQNMFPNCKSKYVNDITVDDLADSSLPVSEIVKTISNESKKGLIKKDNLIALDKREEAKA